MDSILTKNQKKTIPIIVRDSKLYPEFNGRLLKVNIRYDDDCNNGHNSFSITGECGGNNEIGGCIHDFIIEQAPELKKYIKWHLVSSDEPMHYVANSIYHAKQFNLKAARSCAVWGDAKLEDFTKEKLEARLPKLLEDFKMAIETLNFIY